MLLVVDKFLIKSEIENRTPLNDIGIFIRTSKTIEMMKWIDIITEMMDARVRNCYVIFESIKNGKQPHSKSSQTKLILKHWKINRHMIFQIDLDGSIE